MKPIPRVPFTIRRKVTELDVGDVFLYEGHAYRVRRVGDLWNEPDGNFQSLFVDSDYGMRNHWFPLRASKVVRVQSKANSTGAAQTFLDRIPRIQETPHFTLWAD